SVPTRSTPTAAMLSGSPPPVSQHGAAVLLQGIGVSEVYAVFEAGLRWMKGQGIKAEQMTRLCGYRDVLARAHDDRMFADEHGFPTYVVVEAHSRCQDVADLITVADAAEALGYTPQHVRRLARSGRLQREGISGLLIRSDVLTLKRQRKRSA
ncbi:type IV toxin-antitoxin system AbiEi family antitoxin domain-containing protein, partial [Mycobacterium montefiorense]|uniref:type IV toxin-antitoxin system AbiEi family antitoxin domain-containing protein n=1 Tax=Mycobacterium montefiorense TaxID=154654 RepID=UPI002232B01A